MDIFCAILIHLLLICVVVIVVDRNMSCFCISMQCHFVYTYLFSCLKRQYLLASMNNMDGIGLLHRKYPQINQSKNIYRAARKQQHCNGTKHCCLQSLSLQTRKQINQIILHGNAAMQIILIWFSINNNHTNEIPWTENWQIFKFDYKTVCCLSEKAAQVNLHKRRVGFGPKIKPATERIDTLSWSRVVNAT